MESLQLADRNRMAVERINRHASHHGVAVSRVSMDTPVNHQKLFTCPTLAPLFHSTVFSQLNDHQQRRYNQLVGMMQNELICFFEQELAARVLPALLRTRMPDELASSLQQFLADEHQHTAMFRRLNRLAEPRWYQKSDYHILQIKPLVMAPMRMMACLPACFPMVYWVMLLMEERSLMISHRYAAMDQDTLDPCFARTYKAHAEDEVRHVQLDWHLLERFWITRPRWLRAINAKLLEWLITGLFLKPKRANIRLVELLIADFPELADRRRELNNAVRQLADNPGYRQMMYSADSTPISRELFARLPEFSDLRNRLYGETS